MTNFENCYKSIFKHLKHFVQQPESIEISRLVDYDLMKKYYLMAIKKNNLSAMCNLGLYIVSRNMQTPSDTFWNGI